MKVFINKSILLSVVITLFFLNALLFSLGGTGGGLYAQNQVLLDESWFVHRARDSNTSNATFEDDMNTNPELRFEVTFLNDKIVIEGCCGGVFEMDVNYIGNDTLQILSLTEIQTIGCNENFVGNFYSRIKSAFNGFVGENISYNITSFNNIFGKQISYFILSNPHNNSFVEISNIPNEMQEESHGAYVNLPSNHHWSLVKMNYNGNFSQLPYGAAMTTFDIYNGIVEIELCGSISGQINFSWYLDIEEFLGPCFISCGILENNMGVCQPVAGYNVNYLENFKQNVFNFLNDNINQTMEYTYTSGTTFQLIIEDFSQDKLIFHSNPNLLSITEHNLQLEITIYPNPVNDSLGIYTSFCDFCTVKIYSPNGKLLYNESLMASQDKIDVKQLSNGIYFIVVENELGLKQTLKFIKR